MKIIIVYSSVTGNTRLIAESIADVLPAVTKVYPVYKAPSVVGYDLVLLGFWVYRGKPDPRMLRYMHTLRDLNVAVFGTLAAWPNSLHAHAVLQHAKKALHNNRILGEFLCLGKIAPARLQKCMHPTYVSARHPMTLERTARLLEGQTHPDVADIARATDYFCYIASHL